MRMTTDFTRNQGSQAVIGLLAVAMLVLLAACGGTDTASQSSAPTAMPEMTMTAATGAAAPTAAADGGSTGTNSGGGTAVQATLREWAIDLSQAEVPAGKVTFTVTNNGQMPHNLTVTLNGADLGHTATFSSRQGAQTLTVDLHPGTYTLICSLPGHAQRGQQVSLVVK
jgi:plastocyanin